MRQVDSLYVSTPVSIAYVTQTTLSGDDTPAKVQRLCAKARQPLRPDLQAELGVEDLRLKTGAVCVYHNMIPHALAALAESGIPVAAVSTGFPAAQIPHRLKMAQVRDAVKLGAGEIDVVISREKVLTGNWRSLYEEVVAYREACGTAHLKTILATGELGTFSNVAKASWVCMMAGAEKWAASQKDVAPTTSCSST